MTTPQMTLSWEGQANAVTPVVFIPGIDGSRGSVDPIARALGATRRVGIVDYSGEQQASLENLTAAMRDTLAGQNTIDLVGQSIGTLLAAGLAADLPNVRRVVLCSPFTRVRDRPLQVSAWVTEHSPPKVYRLLTRPSLALSCGPVGDGGGHPLFEWSARSSPDGVARRTRWQIGRDFSPLLEAPNQPTLVLMGEQDRFVPDAAKELDRIRALRAGKEGDVMVIPRAGHVFLPSTAVSEASMQIEKFLS